MSTTLRVVEVLGTIGGVLFLILFFWTLAFSVIASKYGVQAEVPDEDEESTSKTTTPWQTHSRG